MLFTSLLVFKNHSRFIILISDHDNFFFFTEPSTWYQIGFLAENEFGESEPDVKEVATIGDEGKCLWRLLLENRNYDLGPDGMDEYLLG